MMKKILLLAAGVVMFTAACSNSEGVTGDGDTPTAEAPALNALWVKVGESTYYADIDQQAGTARIGTIQYTNRIDGVEYALSSPRAVITPDPKSLLGKWQREQTVTVALDGRQKSYDIIFTDYEDPFNDPEGGDDGIDYPYSPGFAPKDDEKQVYSRPGIPLTAETLASGDPHPNGALAAEGWRFFTANEFSDGVASVNDKGQAIKLPYGLYPHNTATMNESAAVRNDDCSRVENGRLIMEAFRLPQTINTGFTNTNNPTGEVDYKHAAYRTYPLTNGSYGDWFTFAPNMRIEVRFRRTNTIGFNNAIWFQGNVKGVSWPAYGEIDLLENPKPSINQTAHFTLHSENFYSGYGNAKTATVELEDMTRWNIYWIELYPEKIVGGVNGATHFRIEKGAAGYTDWPWDQAEGFYMIFSTGMNDKRANGWQGKVNAADFDEANPPTMEFDWVRVYVNGDYDREKAKNIFY